MSNNEYVWINGRKRAWIVAEEKLGRTLQPGEEVHHKDTNKKNDDPDNLDILSKSEHSSITATQQHNEGNFGQATWTEDSRQWRRDSMRWTMKHKFPNRVKKPIKKIGYHNRGTITIETVIEIRRLWDVGIYPKEISQMLNVSFAIACQVGRRKTWRWVPEEDGEYHA